MLYSTQPFMVKKKMQERQKYCSWVASGTLYRPFFRSWAAKGINRQWWTGADILACQYLPNCYCLGELSKA